MQINLIIEGCGTCPFFDVDYDRSSAYCELYYFCEEIAMYGEIKDFICELNDGDTVKGGKVE